MTDFNIAYKKTGGWEGGYANVSGDRGGETYCGIARNFWGKWEGWKIVDQHKPLKPNQIIKDPKLEALVKKFYKDNFWDVVGGDEIDHQSNANTLYDFGVTSGQSRSIMQVQKVLGLSQTGKLNKVLIDAINDPTKYLI